MASRKMSPKAQPPTQAELEARERAAKRDNAPYMPQGNRPFSIFADETGEHGRGHFSAMGRIYEGRIGAA